MGMTRRWVMRASAGGLDEYFEQLTPVQREGIEAVAIDMWHAYLNSILAHLEAADENGVFDRFHMMGHMGTAVDKMRK